MRFPVDPLEGQKTGWFFDQRPNRDRVAALAKDARVLDVFCHVGAFGVRCAAAGAREVVLVDSSAPALAQGGAGGGAEWRGGAVAGPPRRRVRGDGGVWRANASILWCAIRRRSRSRARMPRRGCAPMAGWHGWRRLWWRRVASCSSPRAAITRRWRPGARRSPSGLHRARREGRIAVHGRRRAGPSGASASAGNRISEGAIDPGAVSQTRGTYRPAMLANLARLPHRP